MCVCVCIIEKHILKFMRRFKGLRIREQGEGIFLNLYQELMCHFYELG